VEHFLEAYRVTFCVHVSADLLHGAASTAEDVPAVVSLVSIFIELHAPFRPQVIFRVF
jgi:hypothetical protein